jgi:hypothetical protein
MKMVGIKVHFLEKMQPNTAPSGPAGTRRVFKLFGVIILPIDSYTEAFCLSNS